MFRIQFSTDGAAFEDNSIEVKECLMRVYKSYESGNDSGVIIDSWGNVCGKWALRDYEEEWL